MGGGRGQRPMHIHFYKWQWCFAENSFSHFQKDALRGVEGDLRKITFNSSEDDEKAAPSYLKENSCSLFKHVSKTAPLTEVSSYFSKSVTGK